MTRHYATLFDRAYLAKGLAMYESLRRHSNEPFSLKILPLDPETKAALEALNLPSVIVLCDRAFEHDQRLTEIRETRTRQEYAWTCAANLCEWLLLCQDCGLDSITYLDADLFFFSDPRVVHAEIGDASIAVIPHRLIPEKRHLEVNGKFNVGWVTFKNTETGRACLSRWAAQVRDRCDQSTCGDQKYLDEWPERYGDEVCIVQNIGANVAPWNLGNYRLIQKDELYVSADNCASEREVVFYHFHELAEIEQADSSNPHEIVFNESRPWGRMPTPFRLTNYDLRPEDIELIYMPYLKAYCEAKTKIESLSVQAQ